MNQPPTKQTSGFGGLNPYNINKGGLDKSSPYNL
jgi:hypothetical protein